MKEDRIRRTFFLGEPGWILESETLQSVVLPGKGGKVASLRHRKTGFELLFQNPGDSFRSAKTGDSFEKFEACGFDDAFPTIDAGMVKVGERLVPYPDHGEIWSASFACAPVAGGLTLRYESPLLGYLYEKRLCLEGDRLRCGYRIRHMGGEAFPCIWAFHFLARYEPGMRLLFPRGTARVRNVTDSARLGKKDTIYRFPVDTAEGRPYDFSRVPPPEPCSMEKYYVEGMVGEGYCGYLYPAQGMKAEISYDPEKLPYLGFWVTAGAFRGDFNCALEPATGFYDSIAAAQKHGRCPVLAPGEQMEFTITVRLCEACFA